MATKTGRRESGLPKLTQQQATEIKVKFELGKSMADIAEEYDISRGLVRRAVKGLIKNFRQDN